MSGPPAKKNIEDIFQDALTKPSPGKPASAPDVKIPFTSSNQNPPSSYPSALPSQVDLNYSTVPPSSSSSSPSTTFAIYGSDFPVFITDSQQQTWPPSSSSSLPANPAQQQQQSPQLSRRDFILFGDSLPQRHPRQPNRLVSQYPANSGIETSQQPQHLQQFYPQQQSLGSPAVQNQQVADIIQATGHATSSSAINNNRYTHNSQQFYASAAPSSSPALNQVHANARPPVPLFTQSTGSIPQQGKMWSDAEDFTAFGGGASGYGYDMIRSASNSTNAATVSPSELVADQFMSAPNSSALTALTSPSIYNVSPEMKEAFDMSPSFEPDNWDPNPDNWPSLFPDENNIAKPLAVDQSPALSDDIDIEQAATAHQRRKSSQVSPRTPHRHSLVAGVNARKRDKPLPPIIVDDPNDTVAMKRARNTLAARKSRDRKAAKMSELEAEIATLEAERDHWKSLALANGATGL